MLQRAAHRARRPRTEISGQHPRLGVQIGPVDALPDFLLLLGDPRFFLISLPGLLPGGPEPLQGENVLLQLPKPLDGVLQAFPFVLGPLRLQGRAVQLLQFVPVLRQTVPRLGQRGPPCLQAAFVQRGLLL